MAHVETEIEPPGLYPDDDDDPSVGVHAAVFEVDGTRRAAMTHLPADADTETLADAMVECMLGAAAMRGPELAEAVRHRILR